ncbi:MAG: c-type cytochrome [Rubrivivax sp.]|nr:MAG: c-type cytochrome [Rubrivivax sp.]
MRKLSALACCAMLVAVPGLALANPALAQKKNCMACHAVDKRLVGPSFKDIGAKYAKQDGAAADLATRIVKGSSGRWGPVPMPANPQVSAEEAQALSSWILEQGAKP